MVNGVVVCDGREGLECAGEYAEEGLPCDEKRR